MAWTAAADKRVHGTTHERPIDRFDREERAALRPLPANPLQTRQQRLRRVVSNDAFVDIDTVRYSAPHALVTQRVDVYVAERSVRVFSGTQLVASHERSFEPFAVVQDRAHHAGLWRAAQPPDDAPEQSPLRELGRTLDAYAAVISEVRQ